MNKLTVPTTQMIMKKNKMNYSVYKTLLLTAIFSVSGVLSSCSDDAALSGASPMPETTQNINSVEDQPNTQDVVAPTMELPSNVNWITNTEDNIFADPEAKKGGTYRAFMLSFPLTLRSVGPDSNGGFAGTLRNLQMGLVDFHPNTLNPIPALATHWAFDEDQKTVYYKLDPDARWSDGKPITADDYLYTLVFMRSEHIIAPWYNEYYSKQITDIIKYDDYTIAIRAGNAKPLDELIAATSLSPKPKHFHKLDENWVRDYNWKEEPTTGAYVIDKIKKGKYIQFKRLADWWADEKKFYQYRFNVNKVRIKVVRDNNIAWTYFLKGELDNFSLVIPSFWHNKAQGPVFENGYVHKIKFYNDLPQPASGLWLNTAANGLDDLNVRLGLAHSINIEKVINTVLRGDYERLETHHVGFGDYSNATIKPREFDLDKADQYFSNAGWQEFGADGIRVKEGKRLAFEVSYGAQHHTDRLVILKEEAKKSGVELNLQLLDSAASFKKVLEKKHQISWMAWSGGGLSPRYWEFYHSINAEKTQTNNITNISDPKLDSLIEVYRKELLKEKRISMAHELEQMLFDSGVMIPTTKVPYTREAYWSWVKLPSFYGNKRSASLVSAFSSGLFWIDTEYKKVVEEAKKQGDKLPASTIIDDTWRKK